MTIKKDKNQQCVCIVVGSEADNLYKHYDTKGTFHVQKALQEAQRLANKTGKKVRVLETIANVYPDKALTQAQTDFLGTLDKLEEVVNG